MGEPSRVPERQARVDPARPAELAEQPPVGPQHRAGARAIIAVAPGPSIEVAEGEPDATADRERAARQARAEQAAGLRASRRPRAERDGRGEVRRAELPLALD